MSTASVTWKSDAFREYSVQRDEKQDENLAHLATILANFLSGEPFQAKKNIAEDTIAWLSKNDVTEPEKKIAVDALREFRDFLEKESKDKDPELCRDIETALDDTKAKPMGRVFSEDEDEEPPSPPPSTPVGKDAASKKAKTSSSNEWVKPALMVGGTLGLVTILYYWIMHRSKPKPPHYPPPVRGQQMGQSQYAPYPQTRLPQYSNGGGYYYPQTRLQQYGNGVGYYPQGNYGYAGYPGLGYAGYPGYAAYPGYPYGPMNMTQYAG